MATSATHTAPRGSKEFTPFRRSRAPRVPYLFIRLWRSPETFLPTLSQVFRSRSGASERVTCDLHVKCGPGDLAGGLKPPTERSKELYGFVVTSGPAVRGMHAKHGAAGTLATTRARVFRECPMHYRLLAITAQRTGAYGITEQRTARGG